MTFLIKVILLVSTFSIALSQNPCTNSANNALALPACRSVRNINSDESASSCGTCYYYWIPINCNCGDYIILDQSSGSVENCDSSSSSNENSNSVGDSSVYNPNYIISQLTQIASNYPTSTNDETKPTKNCNCANRDSSAYSYNDNSGRKCSCYRYDSYENSNFPSLASIFNYQLSDESKSSDESVYYYNGMQNNYNGMQSNAGYQISNGDSLPSNCNYANKNCQYPNNYLTSSNNGYNPSVSNYNYDNYDNTNYNYPSSNTANNNPNQQNSNNDCQSDNNHNVDVNTNGNNNGNNNNQNYNNNNANTMAPSNNNAQNNNNPNNNANIPSNPNGNPNNNPFNIIISTSNNEDNKFVDLNYYSNGNGIMINPVFNPQNANSLVIIPQSNNNPANNPPNYPADTPVNNVNLLSTPTTSSTTSTTVNNMDRTPNCDTTVTQFSTISDNRYPPSLGLDTSSYGSTRSQDFTSSVNLLSTAQQNTNSPALFTSSYDNTRSSAYTSNDNSVTPSSVTSGQNYRTYRPSTVQSIQSTQSNNNNNNNNAYITDGISQQLPSRTPTYGPPSSSSGEYFTTRVFELSDVPINTNTDYTNYRTTVSSNTFPTNNFPTNFNGNTNLPNTLSVSSTQSTSPSLATTTNNLNSQTNYDRASTPQFNGASIFNPNPTTYQTVSTNQYNYDGNVNNQSAVTSLQPELSTTTTTTTTTSNYDLSSQTGRYDYTNTPNTQSVPSTGYNLNTNANNGYSSKPTFKPIDTTRYTMHTQGSSKPAESTDFRFVTGNNNNGYSNQPMDTTRYNADTQGYSNEDKSTSNADESSDFRFDTGNSNNGYSNQPIDTTNYNFNTQGLNNDDKYKSTPPFEEPTDFRFITGNNNNGYSSKSTYPTETTQFGPFSTSGNNNGYPDKTTYQPMKSTRFNAQGNTDYTGQSTYQPADSTRYNFNTQTNEDASKTTYQPKEPTQYNYNTDTSNAFAGQSSFQPVDTTGFNTQGNTDYTSQSAYQPVDSTSYNYNTQANQDTSKTTYQPKEPTQYNYNIDTSNGFGSQSSFQPAESTRYPYNTQTNQDTDKTETYQPKETPQYNLNTETNNAFAGQSTFQPVDTTKQQFNTDINTDYTSNPTYEVDGYTNGNTRPNVPNYSPLETATNNYNNDANNGYTARPNAGRFGFINDAIKRVASGIPILQTMGTTNGYDSNTEATRGNVPTFQAVEANNFNFNRDPTADIAPNHPSYVSLMKISNNNNNTNVIQHLPPINPKQLLPKECGKCFPNNYSISGGQQTLLGEFPWMAMLLYHKTSPNTDISCGGSLINSRYVLTAAHCIPSKNSSTNAKLIGVRLGEYDLKTSKDCIQYNGKRICANAPQAVGIEEISIHENYEGGLADPYDIALLRLAKEVEFTNFIKPICLPDSSKLSDRFLTTGWRVSNTSKTHSKTLVKVPLPLVNESECEVYSPEQKSIKSSKSQICAGGEVNDNCLTQSGNSLMQLNNWSGNETKWEAVGVTSYCNQRNKHGLYVKVHYFMPWILSKLKA